MLTRKQFLRSALGVSASALGLTILGCQKDLAPGPGPGTPPDAPAVRPTGDGGATDAGTTSTCVQDGTTVVISNNDGHILIVSKQDVAAGAAKTYDIQGTSDHTHTVAITQDEMHHLAQNSAIMTTSSTNASHLHTIMVACA